MKKKENTYLLRFNQLVFVGLITLLFALLIIFVLGTFNWTEHDFSLTDFENEKMGQAYFAEQSGNFQAEILLYKIVLEKIPVMEAELACKIGKAEYKLGNYIEAINWLNRSLKAEKNDSSEVFFQVALTAHKLKRYTMAEKYYTLLLQHPKYGKEASFNLGNLYFFEYDNQEIALKYYSDAIEMPSVEKEYTDMILRELTVFSQRKDSILNGFLLAELDKGKENKDFSRFAEAEFLRNKPDKIQALVHNYLGIIYGNKNDKINAISHFEKALAIDPEFKDARFNYNKLIAEVNKKKII